MPPGISSKTGGRTRSSQIYTRMARQKWVCCSWRVDGQEAHPQLAGEGETCNECIPVASLSSGSCNSAIHTEWVEGLANFPDEFRSFPSGPEYDRMVVLYTITVGGFGRLALEDAWFERKTCAFSSFFLGGH